MAKTFKIKTAAREPLRFPVTIHDDEGDIVTVTMEGRRVRYHEFRGLDDLLIGEVHRQADPSGVEELKARRLKLKAVIERVEGLDEELAPGGVLTRGPALDAFFDNEGAADLVFAAWQAYAEALADPRSFRRNADSGGRGGADAGVPDGASPDALVPGVRGTAEATGAAPDVPDRSSLRDAGPQDGDAVEAGTALAGA